MSHVGYVLLAYGPKHTPTPLAERLGAASQMERIQRFLTRHGQSVARWEHDYAREPKGAGSLPVLFALLSWAQQHEARGLVVVDDLKRLFRKLPPTSYEEMVAALDPYRPYLIDTSSSRLVSEMANKDWIEMLKCVMAEAAPKAPSPRRHDDVAPEATERARLISQIVRSRAADRNASAIVALRDELRGSGSAPSNVELARIANERGLVTSRGNPWSDASVGRALKRLASNQRSASQGQREGSA